MKVPLITLFVFFPLLVKSYVKLKHGFLCAKTFNNPIRKISINLSHRNDQYSTAPVTAKNIADKQVLQVLNILKIVPFIFISSNGILNLPTNALASSNVNEELFLNSLATMIEAKKVIEPTSKFVTVQAYDNARTNIQFILNQLQLQKKLTILIQNSIDFSDNIDAIESAQEAGNRLTNTAIQYDSTVYTIIFIPSDDGQVPPSAEKYRKQCATFFKSFNDDIDAILKVANEEQLEKAKAIAEKNLKSYPPVLFKDSNLKQTGI